MNRRRILGILVGCLVWITIAALFSSLCLCNLRKKNPRPGRSTASSYSSFSSSSSSPASSDVISQFLDPQNEARSRVRVAPLQWDSELEQYAQWWAGQRAGDCELQHSNGPYGENIYVGAGPVEQAMDCWIDESNFYDYSSNSCNINGVTEHSVCVSQDCGHYTQIVWNTTTRVGCSAITCTSDQSSIFATCNYNPRGNYIDQKPY